MPAGSATTPPFQTSTVSIVAGRPTADSISNRPPSTTIAVTLLIVLVPENLSVPRFTVSVPSSVWFLRLNSWV